MDPTSPLSSRVDGAVPAGAADVDLTFLLWARPFLEGALVANQCYRAVGDEDEALLYLAACRFLLSDVAARADSLVAVGNLPMRQGLSALRPEEFPASHIGALVEATGIPRETARRKLTGLVRGGLVAVDGHGAFRLVAVRDDLLALSAPAFAFARWMLSIQGWPPGALGEPLSLRSFIALGGAYLAVYLSLLKSRRVLTGTTSHVPAQLGINLVHVVQIESLLAREGPPRDWSFDTFVPLSRRVFDVPCHLRVVADLAGMKLPAVRASCRRLAKDGFVTLLDGETLVVGGASYRKEMVGSRRLYPQETRDALQTFARRAVERAARLARRG